MVTLVGAASTEATTITIPEGHAPGDLLLIFAFRDGSAVNPGVPAGWTTITATTDGTSCSISAGWKRATSSAETSGTWTNATGVVCHVYRGALSTGTPIGTFQSSNGTTNTVTYPAVTLAKNAGSDRIAAFIGHRSTDTTIETPPTGMILQTNTVGATAEYAGFDTGNSPYDANWPSTNVSISGTASGWVTMILEVFAEPWVIENYKSISARLGNTGIISVVEKLR